MEALFASILKHQPLSDDLKAQLTDRMQLVSFNKKELVLDANQVCRSSYFIESGILRLYYLKDGREISEYFCSENEWMNSPRSFMQQKPDFYYIDSLENTTAWKLDIVDLLYLFDNFIEMERYARLDMGATFGYVLDRLASVRFSSAKDKYQDFLETYPHIHHRIPLGMVASYVGITPETLSRLRKEMLS